MALWTLTAISENTENGQDENVGDFIIHHIQNSNEWNIFGYHLHLPHFEPLNIFGVSIDFSITNHVVMLWIASIFLLFLFRFAYKRDRMVQSGIGSLLEMLIIFLRDEIAISTLGKKDGVKFTPLIATFFFFILTCNLMGLIPLFTTPTGNINVTGALALITFATGLIFGIKQNGFFNYFKSLVPSGVPAPLFPLLFLIEIMGLLAKHFALIVRLFANMVAGHIVIFAFFSLIIILKSFWVVVAPFSIGFAIFVNFLELLVAFIQAYVFTMLSTLFIGMAIHPDH